MVDKEIKPEDDTGEKQDADSVLWRTNIILTAAESARVADLQRWRSGRNSAVMGAAREQLERAGAGADIMPATLELARAGGTVGEMD